MRQILTNLVANAVKFTAAGEVRVEIGRQGDSALIRVVDTGPGILPHERSLIFEAYRQSTNARQRPGGTGLGLATVKQLVELHGGTIGVESASGGGSVFAFTLPLASEKDLEDSREGRASMPSLPPSSVQRTDS